MNGPNGTPEGHAVSHARHTRHASRWPASTSGGGPSTETIWRMSWIRPRGESASSPRTRYVGQSLRQRPHEMQVARSSPRTCDDRMSGAVWMEMGHTIRSPHGDRNSTRLNSSHTVISYAVFCLKKKKQ